MSNENLWGFTAETVSEESSSKFLRAGIHEAVFVTKLEYVSDPNNSYFLVEMADKDGKTVNRRYFEPKIDGSVIKTTKDLEKSVASFMKILANISRKFNGEDYVAEGESFALLCTNVINEIGDKYVGKPLRTKVVLNKKNFPVLPSYAPIWEDPTVVPLVASKLTINEIDRVKSTPQGADADIPVTNAPSWTS